jgi:hypothetical protein
VTYTKNLNFPLNLGHADGAVNVSTPDEFDGDFFTPLTVKTEFDLAEFTLPECLQQKVRAEFWDGAA